MAEYLEREGLLRELRLWNLHKAEPDNFHYTELKAWLEALPAEDVQPIVRCKDCKLYDGVHNARGVALCRYWMHMTIWDDYCSNGMRKDGET